MLIPIQAPIILDTIIPLHYAQTGDTDIPTAGIVGTMLYKSMSGDTKYATIPIKMAIGTAIEMDGSMGEVLIMNAWGPDIIFILLPSMPPYPLHKSTTGQLGVKQSQGIEIGPNSSMLYGKN